MRCQNQAKVTLLVGKVACGKTTYARKKQAQGGCVFLSLDELHLEVFGPSPTREQIDKSKESCKEYLKRLALNILQNDVDVILDWGFWSKLSRTNTLNYFREFGYDTSLVYFDIPIEIRLQRNKKRNDGCDRHSFKIEEKDISYFDMMFEEPSADENYRVVRT